MRETVRAKSEMKRSWGRRGDGEVIEARGGGGEDQRADERKRYLFRERMREKDQRKVAF